MLLPTLLEEVRCIPVNILYELYVVKFWEGMVQKSLSCTQFLKLGMLFGFCVPFLVVLYLQYCILKILPQNVRCMTYLYVSGACVVKIWLVGIV